VMDVDSYKIDQVMVTRLSSLSRPQADSNAEA
jgi:hypothetical protein